MAKFSIFLVVVALVAGMAGCGGGVEHYLIISSTTGGSVTIPGEGTFTYDEGTVVNLVAEADAGYSFVNWNGNVSTIVDVNATTTTITMHNNYAITVNFHKSSEIWDWYDLDAIRNNLGGNYTLMNDLDSTTAGYEELASLTANGGKGWKPIGTFDFMFRGTFDGQGYEIHDLFINRPDENYVGLFHCVEGGGVIENVGLVNATVTGNYYVGIVLGYAAEDGTVFGNHFTGSVAGNYYVGGLVGANDGTVSNSYAAGSVAGNYCVGGLVGWNYYGTVDSSYARTTVDGNLLSQDSGGAIGGSVGWNEGGTVINCYATGMVTGGNETVGGLVGRNEEGTVSNSFWDTETSGQATSDGGTGKTTAEMKDILTFTDTETEGLDEPWDITAVALDETNPAYIWNIVNRVTYPFLSWEP